MTLQKLTTQFISDIEKFKYKKKSIESLTELEELLQDMRRIAHKKANDLMRQEIKKLEKWNRDFNSGLPKEIRINGI